ncbi:hypothetical protein PV08_05155 [Exophiala spinifera]|uniref:Cyclase n=1 Tax=Exophiala spinifera TaxID=91928 RepID=A0A0D2BH70_9EURO|nr:uncharacterized protein PV08_05155 [Exophiala spinifera]KIW17960.1 hypothetical protein PV08_05155 [Exophiala spinifera]
MAPTLVSFHDRIHELPDFDDIPIQEGVPPSAIWGLWDQNGQKDELGSLNLLTPAVVGEAAKEVRAGVSVSLNLALNQPSVAVFRRQALSHTIRDNSTFSSSQSFDDTVLFNTQSGSQWDGLRHIVHPNGLLYNGVTKHEIVGPESTMRLGIHRWHDRGCITGRGVLIDLVKYSQRHDITYDPTRFFAFTGRDLQTAAFEQGVTFKQGDILTVRTGFLKWYYECSDPAERTSWFLDSARESVGISADRETIAWVWNHHFSAVAGDNLAWEAMPMPDKSPSFHEYLIPSWGTPIGELWDLEELSSRCEELGKYSFMLVSVPLNVPGGVASPPNVVAIL